MLKAVLKSVVAAVAAIMLFAPGTSDARTLDEIIASKKIIAGIFPNAAPYGYLDENKKWDGFDVAVSKAIAEKLGVELEIQATPSPSRVPFVASGKIDFCACGFTRTIDRAKVIDFSIPFITETFGVVKRADAPYKSWRELNDPSITLVTIRGTTPAAFIKDHLPKAKVTLLESSANVVREFAQGRADAILEVVAGLMPHLDNHPDLNYTILPESFGPVYYDGLGIAKGNHDLRYMLNVVLFDLLKDGFVDEMHEKYFGFKMILPEGITLANPVF